MADSQRPDRPSLLRWRIRNKLLVLLLAVALLPLVFITWVDYRAIRDLGHDLAAQAHADLSQQAREQLALTADNYALLIQRQTEVLELLIRRQAREVELSLATSPAAVTEAVIFDTDIDAGDPRIALMASTKHLRHGDADAGMAVPVSYDAQAFRLPRGAAAGAFDDVLRRLSALTDVYRSLHAEHGDLIVWQYTTLESGLHSVYPAHGGYPQDYEPRLRPWYQRQREMPRLLWHPPLVDASTQQVIVTVSMPLFDPQRQFAGVTALDVPITAYLARLPLPSGWATDSTVYIVTPERQQDPAPGPLRILARQTYDTENRDWHAAFAPEWLGPAEGQARTQLMRDLSARRPGILQAAHAGAQSLWAYRPIGGSDTWLLIVLPHARVVAMASMAREEALVHTRMQLQTTLAVGVPLIIAAILAALWSSRAINQPVQQLVEATHRVTAGDFETRTDIRSGDELEMLGNAFNVMVPHLKERFRHAEGIRLAREVQQDLIPATPPRRPHLDLAGMTLYCEETGGDYYDFLELGRAPDGALGIAIGDVSGHGISSALLMTTARALLHAFAPQSRTLSEVMSAINERLADDVHGGRFMTLYYLVVEPATRRLRWVSAGHDPAFLYRPTEDVFHELAGQDIPLGVDGSWHYRESAPFTCMAGDVVLMATDGVWETRNAADEPYGKERLKALLRAHAGKSAEEIRTAVIDALQTYRGNLPQADDLTLVVIRMLAA